MSIKTGGFEKQKYERNLIPFDLGKTPKEVLTEKKEVLTEKFEDIFKKFCNVNDELTIKEKNFSKGFDGEEMKKVHKIYCEYEKMLESKVVCENKERDGQLEEISKKVEDSLKKTNEFLEILNLFKKGRDILEEITKAGKEFQEIYGDESAERESSAEELLKKVQEVRKEFLDDLELKLFEPMAKSFVERKRFMKILVPFTKEYGMAETN